MAKSKQKTGMQLVYQLRSTFRDCETEMGRMVAEFGVPLSYYYILRILNDKIGETQTQIATSASMTSSVASQVIQRMCKERLLTRKANPEDARIKLVHLTPKGQGLRDKLNDMCESRMPQMCRQMTLKDMRTALTVLNLFQKNMHS